MSLDPSWSMRYFYYDFVYHFVACSLAICLEMPPENAVSNRLYNINQIRRLGLFYFTARVIHPSLVWPKKDKKESKVNDAAKEIQLKFFYDDSNFEDYGRHLLMHLKAK